MSRGALPSGAKRRGYDGQGVLAIAPHNLKTAL